MNTEAYRNGCHNRKPYAQVVEVQDGWTWNGRRDMTNISNPMARDCQYTKTTLGQADKGCTGCKWKAVP